MKEFRVKIGLRNNLLISQREARGMTQRQLAEVIGTSVTTIARYETFAENPLRARDGRWKGTAIRLAKEFRLLPEDLWPGSILAVEKANAVMTLDSTEMELLTGQYSLNGRTPEDYCLETEKNTIVQDMLTKLTDRERAVIEQRFGFNGEDPLPLDEVAKNIGHSDDYRVKNPSPVLSRTRVAQIEARALRRLRHSSVSKAAKDFAVS